MCLPPVATRRHHLATRRLHRRAWDAVDEGRSGRLIFRALRDPPHSRLELRGNPFLVNGYHRYDAKAKMIRISKDRHGWFTMVTRVRGDRIQVIHRRRVVFDADLAKRPQSHGSLFASQP